MLFESCRFVLIGCLAFASGTTEDQINNSRSKVKCPKPEVEHGKFYATNSEFVPNDVEWISCDYNYTLIGEDTLKCNPDGTWSSNPPYCQVISCKRPPQIMNGSMVLDEEPALVFSKINFQCDEPFMLVGPPELECGIDGTWIPDKMPRCEEVRCPKLPAMPGLKPYKHPELGDNIEFECEEGFTLIGNTYLHCGENGSWVPNAMPYCEEMRCPKLPEMQGLRPDKQPSVGGKLKFTCDEGMELIGNAILRCSKSGTWVPNVMPHCEGKSTCSDNSTVTGFLIFFCVTTVALGVLLFFVICCWKKSGGQ